MGQIHGQTIEADAISNDERTLAALTHLSGLAGYLIPLGGVIVPIIIWVVKSDSRVISTVAKQALVLNVVVFLLGLVSAKCYISSNMHGQQERSVPEKKRLHTFIKFLSDHQDREYRLMVSIG